MRALIVAAGAALLLAAQAASAAEEWGIEHEKAVRFEAKVVDILCELTGDCPADCGAGKRQLGLLKDDGKLVPVVKNFDIFAGATNDLVGFCGQRITADGLMIDDPLMPMMALQFKRPVTRSGPDGKWSRANWFIRDWAQANGVARDAKAAKQWYLNDPAVKAEIRRRGVYGIPGLKPPKE